MKSEVQFGIVHDFWCQHEKLDKNMVLLCDHVDIHGRYKLHKVGNVAQQPVSTD